MLSSASWVATVAPRRRVDSERTTTRLTNAFSKKSDNLWAAYCLHFAYYSFCRIHKTLRVTPAMEAGSTNRIWELGELLA
jgi:hypothetical protein